jgi:hypothetical protein
MELVPAPPAAAECVIELEGPRNKLRIQWKGASVPDLAGLSRVLWKLGVIQITPQMRILVAIEPGKNVFWFSSPPSARSILRLTARPFSRYSIVSY